VIFSLSVAAREFSRVRWNTIEVAWNRPGYCGSLLLTICLVVVATAVGLIAAYCTRIIIAGRQGWGVVLLGYASVLYFVVPPVVYSSILLRGPYGPVGMYGKYLWFLLMSIVPLGICQLYAVLPSVDHRQYLLLHLNKEGFARGYTRTHRDLVVWALPVVGLASAAVIVNELFGSTYVLSGVTRPISAYLWDAETTFSDDMSVAFGSGLPIVVIVWAMFVITSLMCVFGFRIRRRAS
jgi:hypothetical protein